MSENLSIKIERLEKLIKDCHGNIINLLTENNKYSKLIMDCQYNKRQEELYADLEIAKDIVTKIIKNTEKAIGKSKEDDQELIFPDLKEIIIKLQDITVKLDNKRYVTIEDMMDYLGENKQQKTSVLTIEPPIRIL